MKLSFSLNWMGVVSTAWYDTNKIPFVMETKFNSILGKDITLKTYTTEYSCGRIDVYGHPEHPFNYEYSVDVMESESWYKLSDWLDYLTLNYLPDNAEEIYHMFEEQTNYKIKWHKE